jgi:predicted AAA+ superfamily ATPase
VHACYNVHEAYIPLLANAIEEQFKLYINDTGLLCAIYGFETKRAVLNNTLKGNAKGGIYENIISECLVKKGYRLFYYKPDDDHEVEFLIEKNGEVIPVEVKAGNTASVSLNNFIRDYQPSAAYKFVNGNVGVSDVKRILPHYMVMFL